MPRQLPKSQNAFPFSSPCGGSPEGEGGWDLGGLHNEKNSLFIWLCDAVGIIQQLRKRDAHNVRHVARRSYRPRHRHTA